jgi:hypothetical protein
VPALKAGLLEVADVLVLNKADLPGGAGRGARAAGGARLGPPARPGRLAARLLAEVERRALDPYTAADRFVDERLGAGGAR